MLTTLNGIASDRYVPSYAMALVHAGLGQTDQVFDGSTRPPTSGTCTLSGSCRIPSGTPIARIHGLFDSSSAVTSCARLPPPDPTSELPHRMKIATSSCDMQGTNATKRATKAAAAALLLALLVGCRPPRAGETQAPQDTLRQLQFVGKVWLATDPSAAPGTLRIFLANGTLLMDSCGETYRLAEWRTVGERRLEWTEDTARIATRSPVSPTMSSSCGCSSAAKQRMKPIGWQRPPWSAQTCRGRAVHEKPGLAWNGQVH